MHLDQRLAELTLAQFNSSSTIFCSDIGLDRNQACKKLIRRAGNKPYVLILCVYAHTVLLIIHKIPIGQIIVTEHDWGNTVTHFLLQFGNLAPQQVQGSNRLSKPEGLQSVTTTTWTQKKHGISLLVKLSQIKMRFIAGTIAIRIRITLSVVVVRYACL